MRCYQKTLIVFNKSSSGCGLKPLPAWGVNDEGKPPYPFLVQVNNIRDKNMFKFQPEKKSTATIHGFGDCATQMFS